MSCDEQATAPEDPRTCKFCGDVIMYCTCIQDDPGPYGRRPDGPAGTSDVAGWRSQDPGHQLPAAPLQLPQSTLRSVVDCRTTPL